MSKVVFIGECALQAEFEGESPVFPVQARFSVYGTLAGAAMLCAERHAMPTSMVGEVARDFLGDMFVATLEKSGVETRSIDRFCEGGATTVVISKDGGCDGVIHSRVPEQNFDTVWPRINEDDAVVFGGYFALSQRSRRSVLDIVSHGVDRKATVVYVPGFPASLSPRITKVMPSILENLELASVVMTTTEDLRHIFGSESVEPTFRENICFHTPMALNFDAESGELTLMTRYFTANAKTGNNADMKQVVAAFTSELVKAGIAAEHISSVDAETGSKLLDAVVESIKPL